MIEKVILENIQSIKKLELPLGKVTVIVGDSDVGKSSVIRALLAMLTNSFKSSLLRIGESSLKVSVVAEGTEMGVLKGASSRYFCGSAEFSKVGREVPDAVVKTIGLDYITFDEGLRFFLSIQDQHQGQFLVGDYGGVASKVIGRLSNLGIIYVARRKVLATIRKIKANMDTLTSSQKSISISLDEIKAAAKPEMLSSLESKINQIEQSNSIINKLNILLKFHEDKTKLDALAKTITDLELYCHRISTLQSGIEALSKVIDKVDIVNVLKDKLSFNIDELSGKLTVIDGINSKLELLEKYTKTVDNNNTIANKCNEVEIELGQAKTQLAELLQSISVCPTCGEPVSVSTKSRILND